MNSCHYSGIEFSGDCPNTNCPGYNVNAKSNCIFLSLNRMTFKELANLEDTKPKYLKKEYEESIKSVQENVILYKVFNTIDETQYKVSYTKIGNTFLNILLKKYPFNILEMNVTKKKLTILLKNSKIYLPEDKSLKEITKIKSDRLDIIKNNTTVRRI